MTENNQLEAIRQANRMRGSSRDVSVYMKEYRNSLMLTPHLHTEYEIYYNINGGKGFFVDEHYYESNPNDLFIIRKMHIHRVVVDNPDKYVRCIVNIDSTTIEKIRSLLFDKKALDFLDEVGETLPVKVHLSEENHEKFMIYIRDYMRLEASKDDLLLLAKVFEMLAFIKHLFRGKEGTIIPESVPDRWSEKAIYHVERSFKKCQTGDVAKALGINENYLSRIFKSDTGTSLNNYIIQRKIAEAKKLLYKGESVKDACVKSGFNDCSNFIRTFKKFTGMLPGTIKKMYK